MFGNRQGWSRVGILMLLLAGCPAPPPPDGAPRPLISDRLREACEGFRDVDIEALIIEIELDRQAGVLKRKEIEDVTDRCGGRDFFDDVAEGTCVTCSITVVDELYGP